MTKFSEAQRIVSTAGKPKTSTEVRERFKETLTPSTEPSGILALKKEIDRNVKEIARAVGRHPAPEVSDQLAIIHSKMKEQFLHLPDASIEWLLGGSSEMARGGFQPEAGKSAAQKFKDFLRADPNAIAPQKLLTNIETIATAMGYRAIYADWVEPPFYPETSEQQTMSDVIQSMMQGRLVRSIGEVYTERGNDDVARALQGNPTLYSPEQLVYGEQQAVSTASEVDNEDKYPKKNLDSRTFRKNVDEETRSWVGAALESGIAIRGHTSGTCPLAMAAIDGLCRTGTSPDTWLMDDENFKQLAGALFIPTFVRGDYHSIAETAAGVHHYLNERAINAHDTTRKNEPMKPYRAFSEALSMMTQAATPKKLHEGDALSLREAISQRADEAKQQVQRVMHPPLSTQADEAALLRTQQSTAFRVALAALKEDDDGEDFSEGESFSDSEESLLIR